MVNTPLELTQHPHGKLIFRQLSDQILAGRGFLFSSRVCKKAADRKKFRSKWLGDKSVARAQKPPKTRKEAAEKTSQRLGDAEVIKSRGDRT
jgi:hypothetical protein